jgi:hypothetical protein
VPAGESLRQAKNPAAWVAGMPQQTREYLITFQMYGQLQTSSFSGALPMTEPEERK